jgi:hypothetical protein
VADVEGYGRRRGRALPEGRLTIADTVPPAARLWRGGRDAPGDGTGVVPSRAPPRGGNIGDVNGIVVVTPLILRRGCRLVPAGFRGIPVMGAGVARVPTSPVLVPGRRTARPVTEVEVRRVGAGVAVTFRRRGVGMPDDS